MKIAIVNDVHMIAEALRRVVESAGKHQVIWVAYNGREAVERCKTQCPELILMDLVMPEMNGVEATQQIMAQTPCAILVVTASVEDNAAQVFDAMGAGALDAVSTPLVGMQGADAGQEALLAKIKLIGILTQPRIAQGKPHLMPAGRVPPSQSYQLVSIGASSGGPMALATILKELPKNFPLPVVVIQHVDAQFASELALWLDTQTPLKVRLATEGERLQAGCVYLSERNDHLVLNADSTLSYLKEPCALPYRPSVDVFFDSVLRHGYGKALAVLLTGMGRDGAQGLLRLRQQGHFTIAQDQASCAVYGMPRAAAELKAALYTLPLSEIASMLLRTIKNQALKEAIS